LLWIVFRSRYTRTWIVPRSAAQSITRRLSFFVATAQPGE
jgi:hypothetical protein